MPPVTVPLIAMPLVTMPLVTGESTTFVTNYDDILKDDSINCVIEVMGGTAHFCPATPQVNRISSIMK